MGPLVGTESQAPFSPRDRGTRFGAKALLVLGAEKERDKPPAFNYINTSIATIESPSYLPNSKPLQSYQAPSTKTRKYKYTQSNRSSLFFGLIVGQYPISHSHTLPLVLPASLYLAPSLLSPVPAWPITTLVLPLLSPVKASTNAASPHPKSLPRR